MELSGKTRVFGIIGDPVSHSLSPVFQTRFFEQHGIDAVYVPFPVMRNDIARALDGLWAVGVEGFNITVPYKQDVLDRVEADADARCIGAVNTVRRGDKGWQGTNTDWRGFRDVLNGMDIHVRGDIALMFGAGGTARAVLHALARKGAGEVRICNRGQERLHALIEHAGHAYPALSVEAVAWDQQSVSKASGQAGLVVNATSIGLGETPEAFPFALSGNGPALDVVYAPDGNTPFTNAAKKAGRKTVDGLPMLLAQGAASFYYWHRIMPACMPVLRWLETRFGRDAAQLPAWESAA